MTLNQAQGEAGLESQYLVIGGGRMANHWAAYLDMLGMRCQRWARSTHEAVALRAALEVVDIVFLAISDDALEAFHAEHLSGFPRAVYHFSGCHVSDEMHGCHPLMTFGQTLYEADVYRGITLVLEDGDAQGVERLSAFPNPVVSIPAHSKPLYHALCVMSCNFPQIIWSRTVAQFEQLGLSADDLYPFLSATLENSLNMPGGSITGPLARKDQSTIQKNLQALNSESDKELYRSFVKLMDG